VRDRYGVDVSEGWSLALYNIIHYCCRVSGKLFFSNFADPRFWAFLRIAGLHQLLLGHDNVRLCPGDF
jgi:hypothetical protein